MSYQSFDTNGAFAENYKFLIGSILPRPIAVISTRNIDGSNNLAPFSFFTAISAKPMIVAFAPMIRSKDGSRKDTVINIEREKEFVVNFCTIQNFEKVNQASTELPYGEDEFDFAGLTPIDSLLVKAKRLAQSPVHFECKFRDMLCYGTTPGSGSLITGEVVKIHVDPSIMKEGKIQTQLFQPVGRGAGNDWFKTDSVFELERLMKTQIQK
ncbi:MAG: flavin reductase family protein [Bacteriovoracaceae bacterium]|nr:flavin reductase family protein [Bacteriovoracaceae bacterium]